jgi:lipid-A-disaccharide synthase
MSGMRVYIIAGEASGDLHASNLMRAMLNLEGGLEFRYYGGERMEAVAGTLVQHYRDLSYMGFWEVLINLRSVLGHLRNCKQDLERFAPDALILVDFPSFNLRVAEHAKKLGIPVYYYISPQIWAWKRKRVFKIKKLVDHMFVILPFEEQFYSKYRVPVTYVGHPLLDAIQQEDRDRNRAQAENLQIAILPGSRRMEIENILPVMVQLSNEYANHRFVCAAMSHHPEDLYNNIIGDASIELKWDATHELLRSSQAALVASGTATLETALFRVPQVVTYKAGKISIAIARRIIKVKYISLVNLILDRPAVRELIQEDLNAQNLKDAFEHILKGEGRDELLRDYDELHEILGSGGASAKTAELIIKRMLRE